MYFTFPQNHLFIGAIRDDGETPRTDPSPVLVFFIFGEIEGVDSATSHFFKAEVHIHLIAAFTVKMAEIMSEACCFASRHVRGNVAHVLMSNYVPQFIIHIQPVFIKGPAMERALS